LFCLALSKNLAHNLFAKKADVVSRRKLKPFFWGRKKGQKHPPSQEATAGRRITPITDGARIGESKNKISESTN
jgi:hypothetical protein